MIPFRSPVLFAQFSVWGLAQKLYWKPKFMP